MNFFGTSLKTQDILGAQQSTKGKGPFAENHQRTQFGQTCRLDDVYGASVGSLRKAPATKRVTNPLNPSYANPGDGDFNHDNNTNAFGASKTPAPAPA